MENWYCISDDGVTPFEEATEFNAFEDDFFLNKFPVEFVEIQ